MRTLPAMLMLALGLAAPRAADAQTVIDMPPAAATTSTASGADGAGAGPTVGQVALHRYANARRGPHFTSWSPPFGTFRGYAWPAWGHWGWRGWGPWYGWHSPWLGWYGWGGRPGWCGWYGPWPVVVGPVWSGPVLGSGVGFAVR